MTLVIKQISPKKFKSKVFRAAFKAGMKEVGKEMVKDLKRTVRNWEGDRPKFTTIRSIEPGRLVIFAGATGEGQGVMKWRWLNEGTSPHIIEAKPGKRLAFMTTGFRAKTAPGVLNSGRGRKAKAPMVRPQAVLHPGTKPRGWDEILTKIYEPRFKRRMEQAMREAAKQCGHGA